MYLDTSYSLSQFSRRSEVRNTKRRSLNTLLSSGTSKKRVGKSIITRVPGLPVRDCARGCNNCVHTRAQMSAIDVTKNTFFERLY